MKRISFCWFANEYLTFSNGIRFFPWFGNLCAHQKGQRREGWARMLKNDANWKGKREVSGRSTRYRSVLHRQQWIQLKRTNTKKTREERNGKVRKRIYSEICLRRWFGWGNPINGATNVRILIAPSAEDGRRERSRERAEESLKRS